jgi:dTDP-4-amino-4,6-dideoxygalactose transaminase
MRLAGVDHGSEVITTPMTCTATSQPALERGATLVWADIDPWTGNIDPLDVARKITPRTKAIVAVHWGGYPCDLDELRAVAQKYGIPLVEDAAHAFASSYKGKPVGSGSDFVCFSFQAIKAVTTLDGGLLTCKTPDSYRRGKLLRWFGIDRETPRADLRCENDVAEFGYKHHMHDVSAVIGLEQLKYVGANIARTRENASFYQAALDGIKGVSLLRYTADRLSAYWLFTIRVRDRDGFQRFMAEKGVMVSRVHVRNDLHTYTKAFARNLPGVDEFEREQVSIPVGWWVTDLDRDMILAAIREWSAR